MIYELRIYEILPGKLPAIHQRFADHSMALLQRHGIEVVGFWDTAIGDNSQIVYVCAFADAAARDQAWAAFQADPEWQRVKAESEQDGPIVARVINSILRPTPYSPLQ